MPPGDAQAIQAANVAQLALQQLQALDIAGITNPETWGRNNQQLQKPE